MSIQQQLTVVLVTCNYNNIIYYNAVEITTEFNTMTAVTVYRLCSTG